MSAPSRPQTLPTIAVFDFDGTLTYRDSFFPFLKFVVGTVRFWWGLVILSPILAGLTLRLVPNWRAKEAVLSYFLAGLTDEKLQQLGQRFATQEIPKLLRPKALERLQWHQAQGHEIVVVSASLEAYLRPWGQTRGFAQVIGTQLETQSGSVTGRILGKNCYGKEKVERLSAFLGAAHGRCLYAYGDSRGDKELLDFVNYPYYRTFQDTMTTDTKTKTNLTKLPYLAALRPRQWTKNLVVFAAPLFDFNASWQSLLGSLLAFILFCCASSSFYLINDIADVESDRRHPVKCRRPIAAGLVSVPVAIGMAFILLGSALIIGWLQSPPLGATLIAYALLQIAYNLILKHKVIVDIGAIATGFVLRANAGAAATGIVLSPWFLLCTAMLALFLGVEKRKAELRLQAIKGGKTRSVLRRYSLPLLSRMENVVTTGAVLTYALWSSGPYMRGASTSWMLLTLPFVLYGVFRYQLLSDPEEIARRSAAKPEHGGQSERPEEILLTDLPILTTVLGWVLTSFMILLLKNQGLIQ